MTAPAFSVGLVLVLAGLAALVAAGAFAVGATRRLVKAQRLKHSDAAINFALDRLSWSDGRRFLRLYRSGAEDAIAVRFPKWREYRDWYDHRQDKLKIIKKDRTP